MRFPRIIAVALLAGACQPAEQATEQPAAEAAPAFDVAAFVGTTYGEPLTLTELTPVSAILETPESWVGQRVLIQGMVVEVCESKGCWMEISGEQDFQKIRVKVDDGVIVFPLTARGKQALAEGVVEVVELTHEQALEQAKHEAEEHGHEFDPSTVTGPTTTYRIRGLGAVVAG